ncbi:MAG TPA: exo-alpha-sialidase, partial [Bacteroidetes bacterium]|nr:exo-alpha-sialidase [Bacteroidota bacterium]
MKFIRTQYLILPLLILWISSLHAVNYGETFEVGTTFWHAQQNSTVGKMIARDERGGTHFVWTKTYDADQDKREIYFNFCDDGEGDIADQLGDNASRVDEAERAGYGSIDLLRDEDEILATCFYHFFGRAVMALDFSRGWGDFMEILFDPPDQRSSPLVVKGSIDINRHAHLAASTHTMQGGPISFGLAMWHAEPNDGLDDWSVSHPVVIENTIGMTHRVQASRSSARVSLAWHHNLVGVPGPEEWQNTVPHSMNNDLYLYESPDGDEWEFDDAVNVTRTIPADHELDGVYAYGDTLRPFNDVDLIYVDDVVHAVFTTRGFIPDPTGAVSPPVIDWTTKESFIWHWDSDSDTLTLVADGWYENSGVMSSLNSNVDRPSLGVDEDGTLYCIFRQVTGDDEDENGACNGEIMLSVSTDDGITWSEAVNLTGTVFDEDDEENLVDENFPSLAELVDDYLHIYYLLVPAEGGGLDEDLV